MKKFFLVLLMFFSTITFIYANQFSDKINPVDKLRIDSIIKGVELREKSMDATSFNSFVSKLRDMMGYFYYELLNLNNSSGVDLEVGDPSQEETDYTNTQEYKEFDISVVGRWKYGKATSDGGFLKIAGDKVIKIAPNGDLAFETTVDSECKGKVFVELPSGEYMIIGDKSTYNGFYKVDISFLCNYKIDRNGNFQDNSLNIVDNNVFPDTKKSISGFKNLNDAIIGSNGDIYLIGRSESRSYFNTLKTVYGIPNGAIGGTYYPSKANQKVLLSSMSSDGKLLKWFKTYYFDGWDDAGYTIEKTKLNKLLVQFQTQQASPKAGFIEFDLDGKILRNKSNSGGRFNFTYAGQNSSYYTLGKILDSNFNTIGSIYDISESIFGGYEQNKGNINSYMISTSDLNNLLVGRLSGSFDRKLFLAKVNNNYDIIWKHVYDNNLFLNPHEVDPVGLIGPATMVEEVFDGYVIYDSDVYRETHSGANGYRKGERIMKIDKNGEILWERKINISSSSESQTPSTGGTGPTEIPTTKTYKWLEKQLIKTDDMCYYYYYNDGGAKLIQKVGLYGWSNFMTPGNSCSSEQAGKHFIAFDKATYESGEFLRGDKVNGYDVYCKTGDLYKQKCSEVSQTTGDGGTSNADTKEYSWSEKQLVKTDDRMYYYYVETDGGARFVASAYGSKGWSRFQEAGQECRLDQVGQTFTAFDEKALTSEEISHGTQVYGKGTVHTGDLDKKYDVYYRVGDKYKIVCQ